MDKMDKYGMDLEKVNIERLKEIFPECVTDGKVNFDALRTILGDDVETSGEKYSFNWVGKSDAMKIALMPSTGTLRPCKDKSKDWDKTENLYIEGDNLEVLKTLEKTYHNQIKMIYIDPPYNTGKDFVYHDDFHDNVSNYLENSEQAFRTNPETAGRFHTDWLNMMYPRLKIARELLKEEGVIFISIDDSEQANLKRMCDEIFGDNNFIAQVVWERAYSPVNLKKHFSESHDYILCYAKNIDSAECNGLPRSSEANDRYSNPDNDPRGAWTSGDLSVGPRIESKVYEIETPTGRRILPPSGYCWRLDKDTFLAYKNDNRIWFGENGDNVPRIKRFLSEVKQGITPMTVWKYTEVGHSQDAAQKLKRLFDGKAYFDYPKSVELIKRCLQLYSSSDCIVLDFFSGSATTAHAVMQLNAEDGGHRKYIMVQLPENTDAKSEAYADGYKTICDIGEERIRRAGAKIQEALGENGLAVSMLANGVKNKKEIKNDEGETVAQLSMTGMFDAPENVEEVNEEMANNIDVGFKVFKLDSTNIKPWDATVKYDETTLYDLQDSVVKEDRSNLDIAYEVMLKYGIFNMPLEEKEVNGKTVYSVGEGYMIISLNDEITTEDVAAIAALGPKAVVFKESGFVNDNAKMNADYTFKRLGIDNVKCI